MSVVSPRPRRDLRQSLDGAGYDRVVLDVHDGRVEVVVRAEGCWGGGPEAEQDDYAIEHRGSGGRREA